LQPFRTTTVSVRAAAKSRAGPAIGETTRMRDTGKIKMDERIKRHRNRWLIAVLTIALAGCTAIQKRQAAQAQQLLEAAGFEMQMADTPERLAALQGVVPQRKVFSVAGADGPRFVYADSEYCQCVYVGDQQANERYQRMAIKQKLAAERDMAAQMGDDAAMGPGAWSPW
jgi:hypothetical protein